MKNNKLIILILTIGVFGILNTEMGFIGLIPQIAAHFNVNISTAGWLVSIFAIGIAISGPIMPLLLSKVERKRVMLLVLIIFIISNIVSLFTTSFTVLLVARIIPAIFHPVYIALAFSVASDSVNPKAVAKVFIGVSSGMVVGVPIVNFLANQFNLYVALSFFALVNIIVLILTIIFIPKMPAKTAVTYGDQLRVLKRPLTWLSIIVSILFNAAIFGVYSYFTDFLNIVTEAQGNLTSVMLFLYGFFNILGNIIAGKLLTSIPQKAILMLPLALIIIYCYVLFMSILYSYDTYHYGVGNLSRYFSKCNAICDYFSCARCS